MDETVIVIMLKDKETGFLEKELGCYTIDENDGLIYNAFAIEENGKYNICMKLTCDKEVSDWEFDAIFDYYDFETISPLITSIEEDSECHNPTWKVSFDFLDSTVQMEEKISNLLKLHRQELNSVYEAIADKRNDYLDNEKQ